ncbi:MAG: hypothetical protein IJO74_03085 [Clostridia bacterium]|nr:hypothetical protein [Clostridia bacterium]
MKRQDVQKKINAYFESRYGPVLDKGKNPVMDEAGNIIYEIVRPPTLSGLALCLGLDSREKLTVFTKNKAILSDVNRAILQVEEYAEEKLFSKESNTSGIKLYLAVNFKRWASDDAVQEAEDFPEEYNSWAE